MQIFNVDKIRIYWHTTITTVLTSNRKKGKQEIVNITDLSSSDPRFCGHEE